MRNKNLNTTQVYLSVTGKAKKAAINSPDETQKSDANDNTDPNKTIAAKMDYCEKSGYFYYPNYSK
jgi:hypothetical protein